MNRRAEKAQDAGRAFDPSKGRTGTVMMLNFGITVVSDAIFKAVPVPWLHFARMVIVIAKHQAPDKDQDPSPGSVDKISCGVML